MSERRDVPPTPSPDTTAGEEQLPSVTGAAVLAGSVWNALAYMLPQVYTLALSIVAARFLGPEGMGHQSFIAWAQITVTQLFTGGLPMALVRYVSETLGRGQASVVRGLLAWAWRLEGIAAVLGGGLLVIVSMTRADLGTAWMLAAVACSMGILHTVPNAVLLGLQRWREAAMVGLVTGAVGTIATIVVLAAGGGITGMFAVEAVISVVTMAWAGVLARQKLIRLAPRPQPPGPLTGLILRYAGWNTLRVFFAMIVWHRSELFFLDRFSTAEQIAMYSIAFSVVTALVRIPQSFITTLYPAFANLLGAGRMDRIQWGFGRAFRLLIIVSLPIAAGAIAVGPEVLRIVYGDEYRGTGPVIVIMMGTYPLVVLWKLGGSLLQGLGLVREILKVDVVSMVINIGLALALIPPHGAIGAAFANVSAQVIGGIVLMAMSIRRLGGIDWQAGALIRSGIAAAGAGLGGWAGIAGVGGALGVAVGVLAGGVAYAVVAVALQVVPEDDARWLNDAAGARLGGLIGRACRLFIGRRGLIGS